MSTIIDLITQFRVQFFDKFPYVSSYVYSLNPVCTDRVPTMAVDRTGNMYWKSGAGHYTRSGCLCSTA